MQQQPLAAPRRAASRPVVTTIAICLAALVLPLSFSAGAVATPAIGRALGGSPAGLTWITNAFMLSFGSTLMAAGALADQYGRKRVFVGGTLGFALLSMLLVAAPNLLWLDLLRGTQGLAAAAALASGSAALAQEFEGPGRARAFSLLGATFGLGLAAGPLLAGTLIAWLGWQAVFLSGTVLGGAAGCIALAGMQDSRDPGAAGLDGWGAATFSASLGLFTVAILQVPDAGWTAPTVLGLLAASGCALAMFVRVELRGSRPMLDLRLFRYRSFIGVQLLPLATCTCYVVLLVLLPLRFIGIEGHSALEAGLLMVALSAPMLAVPLLAAWLTRYASAGLVSAAGLAIAAAGMAWLAAVGVGAPAARLVWPMLVIGGGTGLPWGLMDGLSVSTVPKERAGMAAGIFGTTRVASEGGALALVTVALTALVQAHLPAGAAAAEAARRLATGNLAEAGQLVGSTGTALAAYAAAFQTLLLWLVGATVATACGVLLLLRPAQAGAGHSISQTDRG